MNIALNIHLMKQDTAQRCGKLLSISSLEFTLHTLVVFAFIMVQSFLRSRSSQATC
jgi:hypothetical protein